METFNLAEYLTDRTMTDETYINLFEKHRNLVPVFSIEGHKGWQLCVRLTPK